MTGALTLAALMTWDSGARAVNFRETHHANPPAEEISQSLLNMRCIVTLDPQSWPSQPIAGTANIDTGFIAPNVVRGVLVRIDSDWVVLSDGCDENWMPRQKVLMIHTCK
jgi:hypothetical protein